MIHCTVFYSRRRRQRLNLTDWWQVTPQGQPEWAGAFFRKFPVAIEFDNILRENGISTESEIPHASDGAW